jgi:DNA replication protein DnaC
MTVVLNEQLKRLRLSGVLDTFEVRLTQARENALSHTEWLALLLQDEIQRREGQTLVERFKRAKFEQEKTFEGYEMGRYPLPVQHLIHDLMAGHYLKENQHILIVGPTGTGKTHLAQALGHQACRQGNQVRFIRAAVLLRELYASRADQTWNKAIKKFISPELLIIDDFGLSTLSFTQAEDLYKLITQRHLNSSIILTSNRKVEAWVELFPDPTMGNAVVDRISNQSYHIVLEGESYRRKMSPKWPKQETNPTAKEPAIAVGTPQNIDDPAKNAG